MTTVTTRDLLGLTRSGPDSWELPIRAQILGGRSGSLFGGAGLAAGVIALEEASQRAVVWATCQFLATVAPPASVRLRAELPAVGGSVTQGRVHGHVDDREIITVIGSAGARRELLAGAWHRPPPLPSPHECEPVVRHGETMSIHQHIEARMARGMFGFVGTGVPTNDDTSWLWVRMPGVRHDAAALAVMADYLASALGNAFGRLVFSSSLDNTIRFARPITPDSEHGWILCENRIEFVGNGFANGTSLMSNEAGELLATASQSMIVSLPPRGLTRPSPAPPDQESR
jgi:acyl-CoA thioesterase